MGKGGKYLKQNAPVAKKKGKNKVLKVILFTLIALLLICIGGVVWYYNYMLSLITRPDDLPTPSTTAPVVMETEATEQTVPESTSPEDTWPVIVPDKNITNIMLIGQAAREGEEARIADTMILCSINRETKTLTLTSLMRDLRLVWPKYVDVNGQPHTGNNRINMAYNMGYKWAGDNPRGGMELMADIVEYNFGVPVDYSIEINFDTFQQVMEMVGGVDVDLSAEEIRYLQENCPESITAKTLVPGRNHLSPYLALGYARMRKATGDQGDYTRTERQRKVIQQVISEVSKKNILEINKMFTTILPSIVTDMTNKEITNLAFEMIPMLKDLKIQSQRIPFDGTHNSQQFEIDGQLDYQLVCNTKVNGEMLRQSIGMEEPAAN